MTKSEFDGQMMKADQQLIARKIPVRERLIHAWFILTDKRELHVSQKDARLGLYEGANLFHSALNWYAERYPVQATIGHDWGPRLIVIRGEVFRAAIPVHFNPSFSLDAFEFIESLTPALREMLDENERNTIQATYNRFFWQASSLAMAWTTWCCPPRHALASDLIHRGWGDLRTSCQAFSDHDPVSVLFTVQQGPEKFLKAMIVVNNTTLTEKELRARYGHHIPKLLDECKRIEPSFAQFDDRIHGLNFGPEVRYHSPSKSSFEVIETINLAHDLCHAVASRLVES